AGRRVRHLYSMFFRERRNSLGTQRLDQPRHAHARHGPIEIPRLDQRFLLADKVDLVPQQPPDFPEGIGDKVGGKSIVMVPLSEVLGQSLQVVHVLGKVLWDMRLQYFENAALPFSAGGISPGEAHDRADASLRQDDGRDFNRVGVEPWPQIPLDDGAYVL